jgi:hypothetical protein
MIVNLGDKQFRFWFSYDRTHGVTFARCLYDEREYSAVAVCSHNDQFVKALGRRVALTKLLDKGLMRLEMPDLGEYLWITDYSFSRDDRKAIWRVYFEQHKDLRTKGVGA